MSPQRMAGPAYWACGGDVVGRRGALSIARAFELLQTFTAEAERQARTGDVAASDLLSALALELGAAIAHATVWRRAAGPIGPVALRA
jgi:hypothetical protein